MPPRHVRVACGLCPCTRLPTAGRPLATAPRRRFGNASSPRPPLVMIPGVGATLTGWGVTLLRELAQEQEVIVLDNRGQGFSKVGGALRAARRAIAVRACIAQGGAVQNGLVTSARISGDCNAPCPARLSSPTSDPQDLAPEEPLSILGMANDTMEFMSALGLERPNVLGWSMGGMLALALAATHGADVGDVIVVAVRGLRRDRAALRAVCIFLLAALKYGSKHLLMLCIALQQCIRVLAGSCVKQGARGVQRASSALPVTLLPSPPPRLAAHRAARGAGSPSCPARRSGPSSAAGQ